MRPFIRVAMVFVKITLITNAGTTVLLIKFFEHVRMQKTTVFQNLKLKLKTFKVILFNLKNGEKVEVF